MGRYEHLSIFRDAYELALHLEKVVRNFSRYHKYSLGSELRDLSRQILISVVRANAERGPGRAEQLLELRYRLEAMKIIVRLSHEAGAFASTKAYLHVAERVSNVARQNEGWLKHSGQAGSAPPGPERPP